MELPKDLKVGKVFRQGPQTVTKYSLGYEEHRTGPRMDWYDIAPYNAAIWPAIFTRQLMSGHLGTCCDNYPSCIIQFVEEGSFYFRNQIRSYIVHAGETMLVLPGDSFVRHDDHGKHSCHLQLCIFGGMCKILTESFNLYARDRLFVFPDDATRERHRSLLCQCGELIQAKQLAQAGENSTLGYAILAELASLNVGQKTQVQPDIVSHAIRAMTSSFTDLTVEGLAKHLGISLSSLNRVFQQNFGTSPKNYWMKLRLDTAMQMLRSGQYRIKEIAAQTGFQNQMYFATVFRKATGRTPREFQREAAQGKG
ncbi:MAG: helix-turn-helix transcriptional regulator [Victivallales bacterium]|nr:helix-turn-helix transcriptional regulator [Victivallales bacterium]